MRLKKIEGPAGGKEEGKEGKEGKKKMMVEKGNEKRRE